MTISNPSSPKKLRSKRLEIPTPVLHAIPSFSEITEAWDNIRLLVQSFINPPGDLVNINIEHSALAFFLQGKDAL
jgi:hypothetical protein